MIYFMSGSKYWLDGIYDNSMFFLGSVNMDYISLL